MLVLKMKGVTNNDFVYFTLIVLSEISICFLKETNKPLLPLY